MSRGRAGIAEQPGPFGEGAAVAVLAGGLPAEARFGLVAFAALGVGHLPVVAPGMENMLRQRVARGPALGQGVLDLAHGGAELVEGLLETAGTHDMFK